MPNSRVVMLRPHFAVGAILTSLVLAAMTFASWTFNIPILRTILPGFPGMIPTAAWVIVVLAVALLLGLPIQRNISDQKWRTLAALVLSLLIVTAALATLVELSFGVDFGFQIDLNSIFKRINGHEVLLSGGNLSVQSALAGLFLATALFNHLILMRIETRISKSSLERMVLLIQLLPTLTLGICALAAIGYFQALGGHIPGSKFLGLSIPTTISFALLAIGTYQLRRTEGYVGMVLQDSSAGLFMRRFTLFSILGPIVITGLISWGQSEGLYPDSFSLSLFVIFTMGSLLATSFLTAGAISETEEQRIAAEKNKSREALQESEESLRQTKNRLQFALDASDMGTWEVDLTAANRVRWSATTERLFGLQPGTFTGDPAAVTAQIHPEDIDAYSAAQMSAIENHRDLDVEFRCVKPNGTICWLRSKGRATYDARGVAVKISGTVLDVSRERLQIRATEEALRSAQSANDLKSNFLASMSHEIRTPLGAILGFTELLRDPQLGVHDRNEYLQVISRNGETLSQLINDILDLSKVEAGHMNIETIRFPLATVTEEVTRIMRSKADSKGIELTVRFAQDLPAFINSDPIRIKQILFNLVGNAIKFTPHGEVEVMVQREDEHIYFDVRDTGIGISAEQRQLLFRPFTQADGSITRRFGGTGLGLSLSRNLAHLLGGEVELLQSEEGHGSIFRASIRNWGTARLRDDGSNKNDLDLNSSIAEMIPKEVTLYGVEILVVDDSVDNQNLLEQILRKRGARLEFANDGLEATRKTALRKFDVILMDLQMPIMDGFAATAAVRQQGFRGPIIALTAHAMKDTHADCLRVGCTGFLSKPINSGNLLNTIQRLLQEA